MADQSDKSNIKDTRVSDDTVNLADRALAGTKTNTDVGAEERMRAAVASGGDWATQLALNGFLGYQTEVVRASTHADDLRVAALTAVTNAVSTQSALANAMLQNLIGQNSMNMLQHGVIADRTINIDEQTLASQGINASKDAMTAAVAEGIGQANRGGGKP